MDAKSLFLTANADTVYFTRGSRPHEGADGARDAAAALGTIDDHWFRWVIDIGLPGPDRGEGGKYLIVPPGYDGQLPEGGYFVALRQDEQVLWLGRAFLERGRSETGCGYDPQVHQSLSLRAGRLRHQHRRLPRSIRRSWARSPHRRRRPSTRAAAGLQHRAAELTVSFFEMLNDIVQEEPATSLDPELMGSLAAIGIVKGKPFEPDERMKKILTEAAAVGNATSRSLFMHPRDPSWFYYPGSAWKNFLFETGYQFETPIPEITPEGVKPFPPTGYRSSMRRTNFFYGITGISPAMACVCPASARSTFSPRWTRQELSSTARRPTR